MRRRGRNLAPAAAGLSIAALGLVSAVDFAPRLIWNASASAPIGFYRIIAGTPEIGDFVLVSPDGILKEFITARGYLPEHIPLLKRVAALSGDQICRQSEAIFINETFVAEARMLDSIGRKMPQWFGCFTLQSNEIFLLNDPENSLDGRFFGATEMTDVIGVAKPVWVRREGR